MDFGTPLFVLIAGSLLILATDAYRTQQRCFAHQHWTAGATAWAGPAICASVVLVVFELAQRLLNRSGSARR